MGNFCVHFLNGFTGFFVKAVISILLLIIKHAKSQGHSCTASLVVPLRLNFSIIICFVYLGCVELLLETIHPFLLGSSPLLSYALKIVEVLGDRKSTRLNSSHLTASRMPSSA